MSQQPFFVSATINPGATTDRSWPAAPLFAAMIFLAAAWSGLGQPVGALDRSVDVIKSAEPPPAALAAKPGGTCVVLWSAPVSAPITDGYRPPSSRYGPGNRGLEYGTDIGDPVTAVADGVVQFAGPVGSARFVVVGHGAGLRSTYAFVDTVEVRAGDRVIAGQPVATALTGFHLTARVGRHYRDPTPLLSPSCYAVRLVEPPGPLS